MFERYDGPVGFVDVIDRALCFQAFIVVGHFLRDVGNGVGGFDGTTHEDRLAQDDGTAENVFRVGAEGVDNLLAQRVADAGCVLTDGSTGLLHHRTNLLSLFHTDSTLLHQLGHLL